MADDVDRRRHVGHRFGAMKSRVLVTASLVIGVCFAPAAAAASCELTAGPIRAVASVQDADTVTLDDGSSVRLIGAHGPRSSDAAADVEFWAPTQAGRSALERLVAGQSVELGYGGQRVDRNGRQLAQLYALTAAGKIWVQGYLVENGLARAYGLPGNTDCLAQLIALEEKARVAGLGLWTHAAYQVRRAEMTRELLRYRNSFQLVEGTVRSASIVKGQLYLNFGSDRRVDFTAGLKPEGPGRTRLDVDAVKALEGRPVRVRGWIEWRGGPYVQLYDWAEIELLSE